MISKLLSSRLFQLSTVFLLFSVVLFQNFEAVDKRGIQWLYLSILSFVLLFLSFLSHSFSSTLKKISFRLYFLFFLLSFISLFYTYNLSISLIDLSHLFIVLTILTAFFTLLNKLYLSDFFKIISFFLLIELIFILFPITYQLIINGDFYYAFNAANLFGLTGNKNIAAASLVFKLPFLLAYFFYCKSEILKSFLSFGILLTLFSIFTISARASFISLFLVFLSLIYFLFFNKRTVFEYLLLFISSAFALFLNYFFTSHRSNDFFTRASSISLSEESSNGRFELWRNALDFISDNFFIGTGIGNWKLASLPYWKDKLSDYTVPYHAHNDFLEIFSELGFFGFISYVLIFLYTTKNCIKYLKNKNTFSVFVIASFFTFFIDSFFNFPLERPISMVCFIVVFFLINSEILKQDEIS